MDYDELSDPGKAAVDRAAARVMQSPWPFGPSTPVPTWMLDEFVSAIADEASKQAGEKGGADELRGSRADALDLLRHVLVHSVVSVAKSATALTPSEAIARLIERAEGTRALAWRLPPDEDEELQPVGDLARRLESGDLDDDLAVVGAREAELERKHAGHERFEPVEWISTGGRHPDYVVIRRKPYPVYDYPSLTYDEVEGRPPTGEALWVHDDDSGSDGPRPVREWVASKLSSWTKNEVATGADLWDAFERACETLESDIEAGGRQLDVLDLRLAAARVVKLACERTGLGPEAVAASLLGGRGFVVHEGNDLRSQRAHVTLLQTEGVYVAGQAAELIGAKKAKNWKEAHGLLAAEVAGPPGGGKLHFKEPSHLKEAMSKTYDVKLPQAQNLGAEALTEARGREGASNHWDRYVLLRKQTKAQVVRH